MSVFNDYLITLDVDWAPDWCINYASKILIEKKIKATWFITHDSPAIKKLFKYPDLFELGIHPNFQQSSTQGKDPNDVMKTLKAIIPAAVSVRTHGLVQSTSILMMMRDNFNLLYDTSLLLYNSKEIEPHVIYTSKTMPLIRIPFFWEDDIEMYNPNPVFSFDCEKYHVDGLKIFNFHPIHIFLNSENMKNYIQCKKNLIFQKKKLLPYKNLQNGTGSFFKEIVSFISSDSGNKQHTIAEVGKKWAHDNNLYIE